MSASSKVTWSKRVISIVGTEGIHKEPADAALLEFILEAAGEGIVFVQSEKTIGYIHQAGREILRCTRWNDLLPSFTELTTLLGFEPLSITPKDSAAGKSIDNTLDGPSGQEPSEQSGTSLLSWQQEATIFGVPYVVRGSPVFSGPSSHGAPGLRISNFGFCNWK